MKVCFAVIVLTVCTTPALAGTLIPVARSLEFHFDPTRQQLIIPTFEGRIERYDVQAGALLEPLIIGTSLRGSDFGPDNRYLYVGVWTNVNGQSLIHKVDLDSGAHSVIQINAYGDNFDGVFDVTLTTNGTAYFSRGIKGSGNTYVEALDVTSDSPTLSYIWLLYEGAYMPRSANRNVIYAIEQGLSRSAVVRYDTVQQQSSYTYLDDALDYRAAVSRDGTFIAVDNNLLNERLEVRKLPMTNWSAGGLVFDPLQDLLYVADRKLDQVRVFNAATLSELGRIPIGQEIGVTYVGEPNHLTISSDGQLLFLQVIDGIRIISNPFAIPEPPTLALALVSILLLGAACSRERRHPAVY